ncbi:MAG TPA: hypothetical protein VH120_01685 [Gemmataceae bacterium]|nr:hypothetical protein [Gemmataceae bacterium]
MYDGKGNAMGRPRRIDNPTKITLLLSAACHEQLEDLCEHFEAEPTRRTQVSKSEVVERAVAALHLATMPRKAKAKR